MSTSLTSILRPQPRPRQGKLLKLVLIICLLAGLALLLCACDYPGQDPPCVGSNKNAEGCTDPVQKITDDQNGGPWYVSWALDIVRSVLSSVSINSARLGISVFWQVFTNLSSTDFASCGTGGASGVGATCQAASVFALVNTVAVLFLPLILVYKIFKGYFLGGLIESFHEGFLSFFPKIIIGGFVMYFLAVLFSGAFGISNILFDTIIGGAASLADVSQNMLGNCPDANVCGAGIGSVGDVKNIGLLLFVTIICLLASIVFMVLGLVFFLRTIIIFILFAISPLAIVAGLTEEFRPWFGRWLSSVQAMLIAPIPVAICFALVKAFTKAIPSANGDPAGFILQLVYIISFLAIGAILMFKIAGSVGGMAFGLAAAGAGFLTQGLVGGVLGKGSETTESESQTSGGKGKAAKNNQPANSLSSSSQTDNAFEGTSSLPTGTSGGASLGAPALAGGGGADQQQRQLLNTLRSLNENLSSTTVQRSVTVSNQRDDSRYHLARTAGFNMQNAFIWTGTELGVNAPYFQYPPPANNTRVVSSTSSTIEQKGSRTYSVPAADPLEEGATGPVQNNQPGTPPPAPAQTVPNYPAPQVQQPAPAVPKAAPAPTQPLNQPQPDPGPSPVPTPAGPQPQPAPRRLKITGAIPNPYGQPASGTGAGASPRTGTGEPFVIGTAREDII